YGAKEAHQDSGETLRRRTALRNAHQDTVRMHPYFALHKPHAPLSGQFRRLLAPS
ncbi:MAG: hypothetical protein HC800_19850, partial [Phormidesmis sp. RL_2_1]|nr:hypothetical protein [Phormidesmis sp. RL_2_1]